jgi:predicted Zn-dependent protease
MVAGSDRGLGRAGGRLALFLLAALPFAAAQTEEQAKQSQRARELMNAGKYEQAIPIYQGLWKALPGNAGLEMDLGVAQHLAGRDREAIQHLEAAVKARPQDREVHNMLVGALMNTGRFEQAASQLRKLTAEQPDDAHAWYGLGMSYQGLAETAFDKLQKAEAESPWVAALVAETRVKRRQYRSAFFFYTEALKKLPEMHGIHSALAEIYRKTGHPEWGAVEDGREAAMDDTDCQLHSAECEFEAGHDVPLVQSAPATPEGLYWQAKAANELALQAFFRLGQLPESVELHRVRAEIASGQGQQIEAVKEWRAAVAMQTGNAALRRELAISLFQAADYRAALEESKGLSGAEIEFLRGDSLLRLEQPDEALPHLRAALAADPKLLAANASLGLALARLGNHAEAIPHLVKALDLDSDGSLHFQLAGAYRAAGQTEKARAAMAQYQEIVQKDKAAKEEVAREAQIAPPK